MTLIPEAMEKLNGLESDFRYFISYLKKPDNEIRWHDGKIENGDETLTTKEIRKFGYRTYIFEKYGIMGKGYRIKIADCVVDEIRNIYPEEDEEDYTGYHSH